MAEIRTGSRVLDVAAGAGEQTIVTARCVGPTGKILATDISANLLEFAAEAARQVGLENIETRVMDGENLTLEADSFDAVISRVGLIYFPDQHKALSEMRRVLKPGAKLAVIVYSTPERNRFFSLPMAIIRRRAQLPALARGQPGPFSLGGVSVLEEVYVRAGFRDVQIHVIDAPLHLSSTAEYLRFAQEAWGALHHMLAGLTEAERQATWEEIEQALHVFENPTGFEGPCKLIIGVGTK
jgi:SAM-dependent methyltransferase